MGFHSNFPRLVRAIRFVRNGRENRQLGKCVDTIQLQRCTAASRMNREGSKRTVETVLILSYHPGRRPMNRIHENDTLTANKDQENLFGAIRNAVLVLTRILVIGSVVIGLAAAYFITRFTRCHVFPSILLKDGMMNDRGEGGIREEDPRCSRLEPVAIKILHPGIKEQLRRDLSIMRGVCKCVTYVVPELYWLSLTDCIDEFSRIMENQVDMNREAGNLMKFSRNFSGKKDVVFPQPYVNFTQREILVESFHEGSTILDFVGYEDDKLQEKLAKIGIKMMLKMVGNRSVLIERNEMETRTATTTTLTSNNVDDYRCSETISFIATYIPATSWSRRSANRSEECELGFGGLSIAITGQFTHV
nr:uncharacterized protein LOC116423806 isoform X3 [Nomia melanderi]